MKVKIMTPLKILVIEDKEQIRLTLNQKIINWGFTLIEAATVTESVRLFDLHRPIVTLVDTYLPDGSGFEVLREIKNLQPDAAVIMLTDEIRVDETLLALRVGASDFVSKSANIEEIRKAINNSIQKREKGQKVSHPSKAPISSFSFENIIGESSAIKETIALARKISVGNVSTTVLLQGESGTGKDLIAKAIVSFMAVDSPMIFSKLKELIGAFE